MILLIALVQQKKIYINFSKANTKFCVTFVYITMVMRVVNKTDLKIECKVNISCYNIYSGRFYKT